MRIRIYTVISSIIVAIIIVSVFWHQPYLLISLIISTALLKHYFSPINKELLTFIVFGLLGTSMESVIMHSGAWTYAAPSLLNFPIWLPFLWGLAGTIGMSLYKILEKTKIL